MVHERLPEDGHDAAGKHDLVGQLLAAKEASGKTFTQISKEIGLTNAFTAQLFYNQVKLSILRTQMQQRCPSRAASISDQGNQILHSTPMWLAYMVHQICSNIAC